MKCWRWGHCPRIYLLQLWNRPSLSGCTIGYHRNAKIRKRWGRGKHLSWEARITKAKWVAHFYGARCSRARACFTFQPILCPGLHSPPLRSILASPSTGMMKSLQGMPQDVSQPSDLIIKYFVLCGIGVRICHPKHATLPSGLFWVEGNWNQ